ncbi:sorbosone dehydrogenase family protein [Lewinella sp. LCG006]|uniref:PQQ-dependent sugar dehydrogenase n=1 Tax=Lewinella sp. LCG006 TaxID=3231911 RepID=UPI00345FE7DC
MRYLPFLICLLLASCGQINPPIKNPLKSASAALPIDRIKLPEGFKIEIFAQDITNARSMDISPGGTIFVGTRGEGKVYALKDTDGDFYVDKKYVLAEGLQMPNGVAFRDGDLYVAEVSRIIKFTAIESHLDQPGEPVVVYDKYPTETHHGWKFIDFGPDGKLYVPVGAPCNICESEDEIFASITRINPDGTDLEVVQHGVRNTVGFTWHPDDKQLWFTDNGRDMLGDDIPACELNHATADGQHFGYPYCHQGDLPDEEFGKGKDCADYVAPAQKLGAHIAPLGVEFYTGAMFPASYQKQILIAEHGSWNRSKKAGYRITLVTLDENQNATSYEPFASGWLDEEKDEAWGRPVDIEFLPDGSMLVSDDFADAIYRISYGD